MLSLSLWMDIKMLVTNTTRLIRLEDGQYPLFLKDVIVENPNVSFPNKVDEQVINNLGYAVVKYTTKPTGQVVYEDTPTINAETGEYSQTWVSRDYNQAELDANLSVEKETLLGELNALLIGALNEVYNYQLDETTTIPVQVRESDRPNLISLKLDALTTLDVDPSQVLVFRDANNSVHNLNPQQLVDLTTAVLKHTLLLRQLTWSYKDQILTATTIAELPELPTAITLP